jgi:serine/threonine protein kinase
MQIGFQTANLNFRIIKEIGQAGKNSQVFLAHDLQLDGEIVIKRIEKTAITYEGEYYKEAKILYNHEHSNIVKVHYGCEDDTYAYIAMPIYKNGSLKDLILRRSLTVREIIRYSLQFLSGLHHIHSKKLMHIDIKPDNIFITNSGEAALADFGLAKAMDIYNQTEPGFIYSKITPPEIINGENISVPFDIYQAGLTIYCLATGLAYFDEQFQSFAGDDSALADAIVKGEFPDRRGYPWHIPSSLVKVINRSIHPNQNERYQNSLQLMNDLGGLSDWLDWRYEEHQDSCTWKLELNDKEISINMSPNGNNFDVSTVKYMKASGNSSKITVFCNANLISNAAKKLVQKALKELS